jgi:hypothetical protein
MDAIPGLKEIQLRKRELLLESEMNRQVLRVEAGRLRLWSEQFRRGYGWANNAWKWSAPLAGFLLARRFKKSAGLFAKGSLLLSILTAAWKAWEAMQDKRNEQKQ